MEHRPIILLALLRGLSDFKFIYLQSGLLEIFNVYVNRNFEIFFLAWMSQNAWKILSYFESNNLNSHFEVLKCKQIERWSITAMQKII